MILTKYGWRQVAMTSILSAGGIALSMYLAWPAWGWSLIVVVPVLTFWLWVLWFFRDPARSVPGEAGVLVSPADGRVTDITPVGEESALGSSGVQIGIFMSIFDAHVNRSPVDATVEVLVHRPGTFLDARDVQASGRNESMTIHMRHRHDDLELPLVVRQIAGRIARRIVTDLKPQQYIARGQRIGMIRFGSRVELLVPAELAPDVQVRVGQKVLAGQTVLVRCGLERPVVPERG